MLRGANTNLYLHLKWLFLRCFQTGCCFFYHKQSRTLFCLQYKGVAQPILQNFGFHNEYDDEYEKVFIIFWTLQTNFCDSAHVELLLGLVARKLLQPVTNEPNELKL